jgi:hypothetical protein
LGEDAVLYPSLVEFLTRTEFEDGSARQTGTLMLFVEDGRLKVCLNDRAEGLVGFHSFQSLDTILGELEGCLDKDGVDWRKTRDGVKSGRR